MLPLAANFEISICACCLMFVALPKQEFRPSQPKGAKCAQTTILWSLTNLEIRLAAREQGRTIGRLGLHN